MDFTQVVLALVVSLRLPIAYRGSFAILVSKPEAAVVKFLTSFVELLR
jgi:hypothetical protein